jgi:hypothetical protein
MTADHEHLAEDLVADLLRDASHRPAACAALMRLAGQALASLTNHDQACRVHVELARRHAQRAAPLLEGMS